jgi:hypothetical protein
VPSKPADFLAGLPAISVDSVLSLGFIAQSTPYGSWPQIRGVADRHPRGARPGLPAHWLDPAGQLVLRRLVAQAAIAERREARLRELRALDADGTEDAVALATLHAITAKSVAYLLGQLRATPRSRVVSRDAGPQVEQTPRFKPWEIRSRA